MTTMNEVVDAFGQLFSLHDIDLNRHFEQEKKETGVMPRALYRELDRYDKTGGNGFAAGDVAKFLREHSLRGLSRFYPSYSFAYNEECRCIAVSFELGLHEGKLTSEDPAVLAVTKKFPWLSESLKDSNPRITKVQSDEPRKPTVLVFESRGQMAPESKMMIEVMGSAFKQGKPVILLFDSIGGPVVFDETEARREWNEIRRTIGSLQAAVRGEGTSVMTMAPHRMVHDIQGLVFLERLVATSATKNLDLSKVDHDGLKKILLDHPEIRDDLAAVSPLLVLQVLYGKSFIGLNLNVATSLDGALLRDRERQSGKTVPVGDAHDILARFTETVGEVDVFRQLGGHSADQMMMEPDRVRAVEDHRDWIDRRSQRWAEQIRGFIRDRSVDLKGLPLFVFGGGAVAPGVVQELSGEASVICLAAPVR